MKTNQSYRKFKPQQKKIEELEKSNARFKRIYTEYTTMSEELWILENSDDISVSDDFLNSVKSQTIFLEEEIHDWLLQKKDD